MSENWWRVSPAMSDAAARELIYRIGAECFTERALLAWSRAEASAHDDAWRALATLPARWTMPTFPLRAADFIARGMEKGPVLGSALAHSEEMWIREGFPMERKALDRIVNEALGG
jgi:poly(A) polymerase